MLVAALAKKLGQPHASVLIERTTIAKVSRGDNTVGERLLVAQMLLDPLLPLIL